MKNFPHMKLTDAELQELARQLSHPEGETGLKVAEMMNFTNSNLIIKTINSLSLAVNDSVLEIGPGNGAHVGDVLLNDSIRYTGAEISGTMIEQAQKLNKGYSNASFVLTNGNSLPFQDNQFNKAFTVNTIYFWQNPQEYANEIARVMQPGGVLSIGLIPQSTMIKIPFAKYGFTMYTAEHTSELLDKAGFVIRNVYQDTEQVLSNSGENIDREITIVTGVLK